MDVYEQPHAHSLTCSLRSLWSMAQIEAPTLLVAAGAAAVRSQKRRMARMERVVFLGTGSAVPVPGAESPIEPKMPHVLLCLPGQRNMCRPEVGAWKPHKISKRCPVSWKASCAMSHINGFHSRSQLLHPGRVLP